MTLSPIVGFGGNLWMTSSLDLAFSSSDVLHWTDHEKDETPNRLASSMAFFDNKMWIFGGSDLYTSEFSSEIWSSDDGSTWSKAGRRHVAQPRQRQLRRLPGQALDVRWREPSR